MMTSDPIADMLTRIRNANTAKHDTVDIPSSKIKVAIAGILVDEGFIEKYDIVEDGNFKTIRVTLKYGADKNEKVITGIKRISKPGLRVYAGKDEIPSVLGGLGIAILSKNQGIWHLYGSRYRYRSLTFTQKIRRYGHVTYRKNANRSTGWRNS